MKKEEEIKCKNCGIPLQGKFCYSCGQKMVEEKDKKLNTFFEQLFVSLFFADGKFLNTFKTMYSKPGEMSRSHITGI